jgi:glutamyl-tRNA synthetase
MNLNWDEGPEVGGPYGPYRQSERKDIYKNFAERLIADGHAYRCFCTEEELESKRQAAEAAGLDPKYDGTWRDADPAEVKRRLENGDPYTVRFRVPSGKVAYIDDIVRGRVTWDADASLGDFIILRSNGMPVYNFCVAVDDWYMKITHVIRAEEHLTNTLRQILILEALGSSPPKYAHCSLILGSDRSKLSKRHGATSLKQFSEQGFLPNAMMNYLANLGWNSGTPKEIFSPKELIELFDLNRIIKSPSMFDMEKLKWVNSQHIRAMTVSELRPRVIHALTTSNPAILPSTLCHQCTPDAPPVASGSKEDFFMEYATKIAQRDMSILSEASKFVGLCLSYNWDQSIETDPEVLQVLTEPEFPVVVKNIVEDFDNSVFPTGSAQEFPTQWKAYIKELGNRLGLKGKALFHPARLALTGRMSGPDIGDQLQLAKSAEGVISPSYPLIDIESRMEFLRKLNIETAKKAASEAAIQRDIKAKALAEMALKEVVTEEVIADDELTLVDH